MGSHWVVSSPRMLLRVIRATRPSLGATVCRGCDGGYQAVSGRHHGTAQDRDDVLQVRVDLRQNMVAVAVIVVVVEVVVVVVVVVVVWWRWRWWWRWW